MRSRRELLTWFLPAADAPGPDAPGPDASVRDDPPPPRRPAAPPVIPPEIAARAARFRAEREARASATLPEGPICWLDDVEERDDDLPHPPAP